jgi:hypothetical protein
MPDKHTYTFNLLIYKREEKNYFNSIKQYKSTKYVKRDLHGETYYYVQAASIQQRHITLDFNENTKYDFEEKEISQQSFLDFNDKRIYREKDIRQELNQQGTIIDIIDYNEDFQILFNLLKLSDDFEFVKSIIVYIDLILVYGLQEQKYNNKPYDILNKKLHDYTNNDKICFDYIDFDYMDMLKSNINDDDIKTFDDLVNDKTILKNELANSCYFNIIYNTYCTNLNKNSKYKNISQTELANIFNVEYTKQNLGIAIIESVRFFEKYKICLKVFDYI